MATTISDKVQPFDVTPQDVAIFAAELRDFVPPNAFDGHGHLYTREHLGPKGDSGMFRFSPHPGDFRLYQSQVGRWMGDRVAMGGLFFAMPLPDVEMDQANAFLAEELRREPSLRGLLLVKPTDDPAKAERELIDGGFSGFKVYLCYADRPDPYEADVDEFLPEWVWEISNRRGCAIMLHISKSRSLADPGNFNYIVDRCKRYPNARLILAHAARSFNSRHGSNHLRGLVGLHNVYFDNSAICEPQAVAEILRCFGPSRLMFGLDFPVSEQRGRAISVGDGFHWLDHKNTEWGDSKFGGHTLVGIENLLALRDACRLTYMDDSDIERIFFGTANELFDVDPQPIGKGERLYDHAKTMIPGGTQLLSKRPEMFAPNQWPTYYREAHGIELIDMDGKHYFDFSHMGIAACLLGYADPDVTAAVMRRVQMGSMTTLNPYEEVELAERMLQLHPWADRARFTRAGGESMMVAVRIARAATKRDKVAICGYHGWHDWYLSTNLGTKDDLLGQGHLLAGLEPLGVPSGLAGTCLPFQYNQLDEVEEIFEKHGSDLAAVVMEPTRGRHPDPGFLEGVRDLCTRNDTRLVFDEISIGWKLAVGGAHKIYNVEPDVAVFAKSISNGHPMGAIIGREETMQAAQSTFISSAYWTESVGPAAALAAVTKMMNNDVVGHVASIGRKLKQVWTELGTKHGLPLSVTGHDHGGAFVLDHPEMPALITLFTVLMRKEGFLAGNSVNASWAHQDYHVDIYADAVDRVFPQLADAIDAGDIEERIGGPVKHSGFARLT